MNDFSFPKLPGMKAPDWGLLLLSIAASVIYFIDPHWPYMTVYKGLSVSPFAILAWRLLPGVDGKILGVSFLFSSLGDVLLNLGEKYFVFGLGSFLLSHLIYAALFIKNFPKPLAPTGGRLGAVAGLLAFTVCMIAFQWSGLGSDLKIPVVCYMMAITLMGVSSILMGARAPWLALGAILFIISDSLIGIGKFRKDVEIPYRGELVWITYYIGQYLIGAGFIGEKKRR